MAGDFQIVHGGNVYAAMRSRGGEMTEYLDFSANINPLGLASGVKAALEQSMQAVVCYPDPEAVSLKQAIAKSYGLRCGQIEVGNGAVELIYLLCRAMAPSRVLILAPTFGEYAAGARAAGIPVHSLALDAAAGFRPDTKAWKRILQKNDLLFLCNPNNPTGVTLSRDELEPLAAAAAARGAGLVIDESFIDFRRNAAAESCKMLPDRFPGLAVLHSLTKFLAVPGLRLGFLAATESLVQKLRVLRDPWNVNVMAQAAGVAGLADDNYRRQTIELVEAEKEFLFQAFKDLPDCKPLPPSVNFILADIKNSGWNSVQLQEALWADRIMIRNCETFEGLSSSYIRVAVRCPAENWQLIQAMQKLFCRKGC